MKRKIDSSTRYDEDEDKIVIQKVNTVKLVKLKSEGETRSVQVQSFKYEVRPRPAAPSYIS